MQNCGSNILEKVSTLQLDSLSFTSARGIVRWEVSLHRRRLQKQHLRGLVVPKCTDQGREQLANRGKRKNMMNLRNLFPTSINSSTCTSTKLPHLVFVGKFSTVCHTSGLHVLVRYKMTPQVMFFEFHLVIGDSAVHPSIRWSYIYLYCRSYAEKYQRRTSCTGSFQIDSVVLFRPC
jgi:hypothetical protein